MIVTHVPVTATMDISRYYDNQMNTGLTAKEESSVGTDSPGDNGPVIVFVRKNG